MALAPCQPPKETQVPIKEHIKLQPALGPHNPTQKYHTNTLLAKSKEPWLSNSTKNGRKTSTKNTRMQCICKTHQETTYCQWEIETHKYTRPDQTHDKNPKQAAIALPNNNNPHAITTSSPYHLCQPEKLNL